MILPMHLIEYSDGFIRTGSLGSVEESSDIDLLKQIYKKYYRRKRAKAMYFYAFKYVEAADRTSPIYKKSPLIYTSDAIVEMPREDCDRNPKFVCGKGINVASNWWCIKESDAMYGYINEAYKIIQLRIQLTDIVCIPNEHRGKFRVCKVLVL